MKFPTTLNLLAMAAAFATAVIALPVWRKWCLRVGLVDDPGQRKIHPEPTALAGGLTVMSALLVTVTLGALVSVLLNANFNIEQRQTADSTVYPFQFAPLDFNTVQLLSDSLDRSGLQLAGLVAGAFGMLILGLVDDKWELPPAAKLAGQLLVAFLVPATGARIPLFAANQLFNYIITVLWILTVVNAFNFTDNMNGLCAGLGLLGAVYFFIICASTGQYLGALIAALTGGALLGFLPYNFPRARAFLGDSGSHLVGYLLAILAILQCFGALGQRNALALLSPLLILAVPLGDLIRVVALRWWGGKPFYVGDTNHLSHRLVQMGLSRVQAVLLIWCMAGLIGALVLIWN